MKPSTFLWLAGLASAALLAPASRATMNFQSGPAQVALVELYTSEGCSSCPPAEKWLGELRTAAGLWRRFVPVAFHVNYWDHLGWRDALATKEFTQRQYTYADAWGASGVYTPCVIRNGAEWRSRDGADALAEKNPRAAGALALAWEPDGTCRITFTPAPPTAKDTLAVSVALLGGGIVSQVKAGENSGRELHHEFVALRLATAPLTRGDDGIYSATLRVPPTPPSDRKLPVFSRRAVAGWVSEPGKPAPLQATGGWIE
jgi:hypothetical protein